MGYAITLLDCSTDVIDDVDGYGQEGPLTTFFRTEPGRAVRLDPWCTRVFSIRTDRILTIRESATEALPRLHAVS